MSENNFYTEQYRPQIHFSPAKNWINDPNGLVYADGIYHLFYQHNPSADVWGNMSWGHATSTDLLHWHHQPVAIEPGTEPNSFVFSGGAVHDFDNCSGLGEGDRAPLLAFYTHSGNEGQKQRQCISYSVDGGASWREYHANPVIENPGLKDFRDPKVFWYAPGSIWVMLIAAGQSLYIYHSENLLQWTHISTFGERLGAHGGDWECPDLFPLAIDGDKSQVKWVMLVSINPGAPNGGSATQYFIGEFDGSVFTPDDRRTRWMDYGPDSYAGITWEAAPGVLQERVLIAWMNNWTYALNLPTQPWRGQMTLPRELNLLRRADGLALSSRPIGALTTLRSNQQSLVAATIDSSQVPVLVPAVCELKLNIDLSHAEEVVGLRLFNEHGEQVEVYLDLAVDKLVIDRCKTLINESLKSYPYSYSAELTGQDLQAVDLQVVIDQCSIEVFALGGTVVMTSLLFTRQPLTHLEFFCSKGQAKLLTGELWELNSTWISSSDRCGSTFVNKG